MNIYRSFEQIPRDDNTVLTVGTFDGVHSGHRVIIRRLIEISKTESLRPVLITIDPHPKIVLKSPGSPPFSILTDIDERLRLFDDMGLENVLIIPFSYEFSRTKPEHFISNYLFGKVGMSKILIGYDHLFGKNREGSIELLQRLTNELGFEIEKVNPFSSGDRIVSSTAIRNSVKSGNMTIAADMLSYDYIVSGEVIYGDRRGRDLGFPTANIRPANRNKLLPGNGVYFISSIIDGKKYFGMANIGFRPTFKLQAAPMLEAHFFDFDSDIYGRKIAISFISFIRNEKKFDSVVELQGQLRRDKLKYSKLILEYKT